MPKPLENLMTNHPTDLTLALRQLDRHADTTAHRDRARINALLLEIFTNLLPASALTERENHLQDIVWRWRLDLAERAGHALPRATMSSFPGEHVEPASE